MIAAFKCWFDQANILEGDDLILFYCMTGVMVFTSFIWIPLALVGYSTTYLMKRVGNIMSKKI